MAQRTTMRQSRKTSLLEEPRAGTTAPVQVLSPVLPQGVFFPQRGVGQGLSYEAREASEISESDKPMRCLITGIGGFAASHLAEALLEKGYEVYGTKRARSNAENISHIEGIKEIFVCDITDSYSVREVVKKVKPHYIYHLAAQSFVPLSWKAPLMTFETNVGGTINVLEAARELDTDPKILVTSSFQVYGNAPLPYQIDTIPDPVNPYDVSKLAQELVARSYFKSYGLQVVITRAGNITGPRRQDFMAESSFAKQIARAEKGLQEEISVGNLEATRDYVDVRDIVQGYIQALESGEPGQTYLLSRGEEVSIKEILDTLISLSNNPPRIVTDPQLLRPADTPRMLGKPIHWFHPQIPIKKSLEDLLNYHRNRI